MPASQRGLTVSFDRASDILPLNRQTRIEDAIAVLAQKLEPPIGAFFKAIEPEADGTIDEVAFKSSQSTLTEFAHLFSVLLSEFAKGRDELIRQRRLAETIVPLQSLHTKEFGLADEPQRIESEWKWQWECDAGSPVSPVTLIVDENAQFVPGTASMSGGTLILGANGPFFSKTAFVSGAPTGLSSPVADPNDSLCSVTRDPNGFGSIVLSKRLIERIQAAERARKTIKSDGLCDTLLVDEIFSIVNSLAQLIKGGPALIYQTLRGEGLSDSQILGRASRGPSSRIDHTPLVAYLADKSPQLFSPAKRPLIVVLNNLSAQQVGGATLRASIIIYEGKAALSAPAASDTFETVSRLAESTAYFSDLIGKFGQQADLCTLVRLAGLYMESARNQELLDLSFQSATASKDFARAKIEFGDDKRHGGFMGLITKRFNALGVADGKSQKTRAALAIAQLMARYLEIDTDRLKGGLERTPIKAQLFIAETLFKIPSLLDAVTDDKPAKWVKPITQLNAFEVTSDDMLADCSRHTITQLKSHRLVARKWGWVGPFVWAQPRKLKLESLA
jgi:hypothetical protein